VTNPNPCQGSGPIFERYFGEFYHFSAVKNCNILAFSITSSSKNDYFCAHILSGLVKIAGIVANFFVETIFRALTWTPDFEKSKH
jgi:hypothetical protein